MQLLYSLRTHMEALASIAANVFNFVIQLHNCTQAGPALTHSLVSPSYD